MKQLDKNKKLKIEIVKLLSKTQAPVEILKNYEFRASVFNEVCSVTFCNKTECLFIFNFQINEQVKVNHNNVMEFLLITKEYWVE